MEAFADWWGGPIENEPDGLVVGCGSLAIAVISGILRACNGLAPLSSW